jgi:dienelactone hydrolase
VRRSLRIALPTVLVLGLLGGLLLAAPTYVRGLSLVLRATGRNDGWAGALTSWRTQPVDVTELQVPSRHGPLRARFYRPREPQGHPVVLTSGVHADGIDEPRLVMLARALAAEGLPVLTPEPEELLRYEITPRLTDRLEDAATWTASQPHLAPDGKVSLFGISFSGGLSVVAAGRPGLKDKVAATLSFGGHGDLSRVLAFLCTGVKPDGQRLKPHDYGVVIILLNVAGQLVPPSQVEPLREAIRTFLRASHLTLTDSVRAEETFAEARRMQARLPEPAARLMGYVNTRDVAALGPLLLPYVQAFSADPALSPERSPPPVAPVYLLHGADDTVIPAIESALLREALAPHTDVHRLATPLITHAEFDRKTGVRDVFNLITLWSGLLSE